MSFGQQLQLTPKGYEQITVSTLVKSLTVPAGAKKAILRVSTNPIRWRDDGIAPTAAIGMPLVADNEREFEGVLEAVRLIRSGAADATVDVSYYA